LAASLRRKGRAATFAPSFQRIAMTYLEFESPIQAIAEQIGDEFRRHNCLSQSCRENDESTARVQQSLTHPRRRILLI